MSDNKQTQNMASPSPSQPARVLAVISGALILAACASSQSPPLTLSQGLDTEVTIMCTSSDDLCIEATRAFEAETGIRTEYVRVSTGEGIARLRAEADHSTFDVWFGGPSVGAVSAALDGNIEPYISPNAAAIPAELRAQDGTWTGIYLGALGFCSNVEYLEALGIEAPESYADLLDSALVDKVAMADQRTSGTAATAGANLVAVFGSQDAALDYLAKLDKNISHYTRSGSTPGHMVAFGEAAVAVVFSHDCLNLRINTGVDLKMTYPSEGTAYEIGQVSLIRGAKHPQAARSFIDWALTPHSQEIAASVDVFSVPTNPDAAVPDQAVSFEDLVIAEGFTTALAEDLSFSDFAERFGQEVRDGQGTSD